MDVPPKGCWETEKKIASRAMLMQPAETVVLDTHAFLAYFEKEPGWKDVSRLLEQAARGGISYADCFAAGLAHDEAGPVVTGDLEFRTVEDRVDIHWIGPAPDRS